MISGHEDELVATGFGVQVQVRFFTFSLLVCFEAKYLTFDATGDAAQTLFERLESC